MEIQNFLPFEEKVTMSNASIRGRWEPVSVWEPRIVALVASKVKHDDIDLKEYKIPVAELKGLSNIELSGDQYQEIKKSIEHLANAIIKIKGQKDGDFRIYHIFAMCGYENGHIVAAFHPDLKPHFLDLKSHFTTYSLFDFLRLPSLYSKKLFEILKSYSNLPVITIELTELHELLNVKGIEIYVKDFAQLRKRVLDKAHKDIHKFTDLKFEWEPIKKGNKVTAIRFIFNQNHMIEHQKEKTEADKKTLFDKNNKLFFAVKDCRKKHNLKTGEKCQNPKCSAKKRDLCNTW